MDEQLMVVDVKKKRSSVESVEIGIVIFPGRKFNGLYSRQKLICVLFLSLTRAIDLL
jgi:hypothetical protein